LIKNKNNTSKENGYTSNDNKTWNGDEPAKKKQKLNTNELDVLKLKLSRENLNKFEKLYKKYLSNSVQGTIVTIANILNIISISNKHLKARIVKSIKNKSEAEKFNEICDAHQLHRRYQKILEKKLKKNVIDVISPFAELPELEFNIAFQMFFLSILSVILVMGQPQFRKGGMKNLSNLLWNSLKNSEYNHPKIFSILRSKKFQHDCINLKSQIGDRWDIDPGVTDFYLSKINSREYFQAVIDGVTSDSTKDLELLIEDATFRCRMDSEFKNPIDSSTVKHLNYITPVTENIQSPINFGKTIEHGFLAKNPDGTCQ